MSRKVRRILLAIVLFIVFIALWWFIRLMQGPLPLPTEAALRRAERQYLRPAGEIVEIIDDGDLSNISIVTRSDGEIFTYCIRKPMKDYETGKRVRLARSVWSYEDSVGSPGCRTPSLSSTEYYYGHFGTTTVSESKSYYLLKQEDEEAVRAVLRVDAATPDGGEQSWTISSKRENPYYFKFAVTRRLNDPNRTWSVYSLLGGYYPLPPEGTVAVAEARFYDAEDDLIDTMTFTVWPLQGGEENGA